jgi:hypothetical protein
MTRVKAGAKLIIVDREKLHAKPALPAWVVQLEGKKTKTRGARVLVWGPSVCVQAADEETGKEIAYLVTDAEVDVE